MPADRRGLRAQLQQERSGNGDASAGASSSGGGHSPGGCSEPPPPSSQGRGGKSSGGKGRKRGDRGGGGGGYAGEAALGGEAVAGGAAAAAAGDPGGEAPAAFVELDGVPWKLLPCEAKLAGPLRDLAGAADARGRDAATLAVLRAHSLFVEVKGASNDRAPLDLGEGLGLCTEEHFRMNIRVFNKWLKSDEGRPFAKQAGGPSDDGMYTLSNVLRRCMPRGLSYFSFAGAPGEEVLIRGFRKFTGLTAEDEDEESGATNMYEDFYYTKDAAAARFTVTTKSNGENGKFAVRQVAGKVLLFAGSKNTCLVWRDGEDVTKLHPSKKISDGSLPPGPLIAAKVQGFWNSWDEKKRNAFMERAAAEHWTLMLEHNCSQHEHVFPIAEDFVEFVAILDREGLPLQQKQAFAFFDAFGLPRVRCEEGLPMAELPRRLAEERAAVDREGAVLYLETDEGAPVGLLKVKSNFYVRARRTRETFWATVVRPYLRGDDLEAGAPAKAGKGGFGWRAAEARLRAGMKDLKHVDGCAEHWQEWAEVAVGFVRWWHSKLDAATSDAARRELAKMAQDRFGSTYRDYCRDAGLPGGEN